MNIEIKNIFNGNIIICGEYESIKDCLQKNRGADIWGANLRGANLRGADLREANLREANLRGANLREANLRGANLREADLWEANLWEANLREADLWEANLRGANLREANLRGANLWEADLWEADLRGAKINIKHILSYMSIQHILTLINWGELSHKLTLEMMRHDAESCGNHKMTIWATGGECPFANSKRDYLFQEKKELWIEGVPKLRGMELLKALCKEKGYKLEADNAV